MPIDDLYQVYASAERFLRFSLPPRDVPVVWHIVGHALSDSRLAGLIVETYRQRGGCHLFLVVDVNPSVPRDRLKAALGYAPGDVSGTTHRVLTRMLRADEYMARLARTGLLGATDTAVLEVWFTALPPSESELA